MKAKKAIYGLTDIYPIKSVCSRCEQPLHYSSWKGKYLIFSFNKKLRTGFYCIACLQHTQFKLTEKELDEFIFEKIEVVIH